MRYLRDAPLEYSTFPFDMTPEVKNPDAPVPINPLKVFRVSIQSYRDEINNEISRVIKNYR